jgi:hypothetical protein
MPEFISKVQHNTYEKGEFSDEKVRTLSETLELVKTFPFDAERTLTEIQLTGPSVTIQDEYINYLKVGLYFNGKLCIYYLDNDGHLYECYVLNVDAACSVVTDFFNDQLDLSKFEKHVFNIGSKKHFENKDFDYTIKATNFYWRLLLSLFFLSFMIVMACKFPFLEAPIVAKILMTFVFITFSALMLYTVFLTVAYYRKSKDMFLNLSAGNRVFEFGIDDQINTYNKTEISIINIYGSPSSRGTPVFNIVEILFKDKTIIQFPVMLIDQFDLQAKFHDVDINVIDKVSELRRKRWEFATG